MISFGTYVAAALLCLGGEVATAAETLTSSPGHPATIQGKMAAKKEASWTVVVENARKGRLWVFKGKAGVSADIYDAQNNAANEGVSEQDWFPVTPGLYVITVSNITALGSRSAGQDVAYEIRFEVKK